MARRTFTPTAALDPPLGQRGCVSARLAFDYFERAARLFAQVPRMISQAQMGLLSASTPEPYPGFLHAENWNRKNHIGMVILQFGHQRTVTSHRKVDVALRSA